MDDQDIIRAVIGAISRGNSEDIKQGGGHV